MMTIRRLITIVGVSAALAVFPLTLGAVTATKCVCSKPTAASYTWDFHREADTLFNNVQADSWQVKDRAAKLQSFSFHPDMSWQAHVDQLSQMKKEVNDMGQKLCRLETIRRAVAPWQQKTIDRIAPSVVLMADSTQDAILYVNAHRYDLTSPTYRQYVDNLYAEGSNLTQSAEDAVQYAKVLGEYHELRGEIGVGPKPS